MSFPSSFSSRLYHARKDLGLTQAQVADLVSISTRWYQLLEKGTESPGHMVMLRLMILLQIDPREFTKEVGLNMTTYEFRAVEQVLSTPELGNYTTYGIRAYRTTPSGDTTECALVSDVSCDQAFAADIAKRFTLYQLDPVHLMDAVLDAIA